MIDWDGFLVRLQGYPSDFHIILPPCPTERIEAVEKKLGKLPTTLVDMLRRFNGAKLFLRAGPSFSLFGISTIPRLPPLEWAADWYIDTFTPKWRAAGSNRQGDWAIGMTNYGGLVLLGADDTTKEWDTAQKVWLSAGLPLRDWIEKLITEGETIMAES